MENFVLLPLCFGIGIVLRVSGRLPEATPAALNGFILHVALPALTLHHLRHLHWELSLLAPLAMAWVLFGAGCAFFCAAQRVFRWPAATTGALILTGALGNTSFIGLPMIEVFFGREHVALGILIDQLGTYVVLSTVGLLVAVRLTTGATSIVAMGRRLIGFPPLLAVLAALVTTPFVLPAWAEASLARLGDTLAPLALMSVGFQLRFGALGERWRPLLTGLAYKLVAGPLLILVVFVALFGLDSTPMRIAVFEAAMAPMIGGAIVAAQYKLDPELGALMLGIGIPLSFLTVPMWWLVLGML